jgi:hypothetical protein
MNMTVECDSIEQFMQCVALAIQNGLTFKGNASTMTIHFLGGY